MRGKGQAASWADGWLLSPRGLRGKVAGRPEAGFGLVEKDRGERKLGSRGRGWAGLVWGFGLDTGFGFLSFLFLSSFSNKLKPHSNLIEFKPNLNSNPMHSSN